jgi:hypothetical protein
MHSHSCVWRSGAPSRKSGKGEGGAVDGCLGCRVPVVVFVFLVAFTGRGRRRSARWWWRWLSSSSMVMMSLLSSLPSVPCAGFTNITLKFSVNFVGSVIENSPGFFFWMDGAGVGALGGRFGVRVHCDGGGGGGGEGSRAGWGNMVVGGKE